jgi:hypothetical protein
MFERCGGKLLGRDGEPMAWSYFVEGDHRTPPPGARDEVGSLELAGTEADELWEAVSRICTVCRARGTIVELPNQHAEGAPVCRARGTIASSSSHPTP